MAEVESVESARERYERCASGVSEASARSGEERIENQLKDEIWQRFMHKTADKGGELDCLGRSAAGRVLVLTGRKSGGGHRLVPAASPARRDSTTHTTR